LNARGHARGKKLTIFMAKLSNLPRCLKWENNGELSSTDQRRIIAVMCAMDPSNCPDQSRNDQDA